MKKQIKLRTRSYRAGIRMDFQKNKLRKNKKEDGMEGPAYRTPHYETKKTTKEEIYNLVSRWPDRTCSELEKLTSKRKRSVIYRWICKLRNEKLVTQSGKRRCSVTGLKSTTWTVKKVSTDEKLASRQGD